MYPTSAQLAAFRANLDSNAAWHIQYPFLDIEGATDNERINGIGYRYNKGQEYGFVLWSRREANAMRTKAYDWHIGNTWGFGADVLAFVPNYKGRFDTKKRYRITEVYEVSAINEDEAWEIMSFGDAETMDSEIEELRP